MHDQLRRLNQIKRSIGNTPLLEISLLYKGEPMKIYAKAEHYNLTGSIKDRAAYNILKTAYLDGRIKGENCIVEATSGNMGISFCALGSLLSHKVVIYMPDWMSVERIRLMESYGAQVRLVSKEEGGFLGCLKACREFECEGGKFMPSQFSNIDNTLSHYKSTAPEAASQLASLGLTANAVVAGVGTGGTIMGMGRYFSEKYGAKVYALEPSNSPTMSNGYKNGSHRIQGISDDFVPDLVKDSDIYKVTSVDDGDSIIMAQRLSRELGLGVGISSGANLLGAVKVCASMGSKSVVLTVFADDNKKYLTTDYGKEEPVKSGSISSEIKLLGVNAVTMPKIKNTAERIQSSIS